jgi:thiopurine S-methyltransferase
MSQAEQEKPWKALPDELQEDNMKAYWERAWNVQQTGWKAFEASKPFHDNITKCLRSLGRIQQDAADPTADIQAFLKGKRVLVPLCGDTFAVRYFFDQGAAAVVGVDLALAAIEQNATINFPETDGFTKSKDEIECRSTGNSSTSVTRFTITRGSSASVATLLAGSLFDVPAEMFGGPFDVVYDRASMVALPPSLRSAYVNTLASLAPRAAGHDSDMHVVLELVRRRRDPPEALLRGPPFDIPVDEVQQLYAGATQRDNVAVVVVDDGKAVAFAAGSPVEGDSLDVLPPFRFCLYSIVI